MKNIFRIIKKEMDKIFKDPRALFGTILFPGLMIFIIYGAMGTIMTDTSSGIENHESNVKIVNASSDLKDYIEKTNGIDYGKISTEYLGSVSDEDIKQYEHNLEVGGIDLLVIFKTDISVASNINKCDISIYANSAKDNSSTAYARFITALEGYKTNRFKDEISKTDIYKVIYTEKGTETGIAGKTLAMLVPMLVITFVMSGALSVCSDSFAGEKERGTLATLMMTPIKRSDMVVGKVVSNTIVALLSAISSFIGIIFSLPNTLGGGTSVSVSYGFGSYFMIFLIIVAIALLSVSLLSSVSVVAKSVKEASLYSTPIYLIGVVAALIPGFSGGMPKGVVPYLIPIYNCSLGIKGVLTFDLSATEFTLIITSTLVYFVLICFILSNLFKKESIMFGK